MRASSLHPGQDQSGSARNLPTGSDKSSTLRQIVKRDALHDRGVSPKVNCTNACRALTCLYAKMGLRL